MSVSGLAPLVRSRADTRSSSITLRVTGLITIIVKPSRPPQSPTIRSWESKAMVAHSRTP